MKKLRLTMKDETRCEEVGQGDNDPSAKQQKKVIDSNKRNWALPLHIYPPITSSARLSPISGTKSGSPHVVQMSDSHHVPTHSRENAPNAADARHNHAIVFITDRSQLAPV
jgi:hypothetical protein